MMRLKNVPKPEAFGKGECAYCGQPSQKLCDWCGQCKTCCACQN